MKKLIAFILILGLMSFDQITDTKPTVNPSVKKYKFEMTEDEVNRLLYSLDNSTAPHATYVKPSQELILNQIRPQLVDTTKPKK